MLLDRVLSDLALTLRPFAVCEVAAGWRLRLGKLDWVTVHFVVAGSGRLRGADGTAVALRQHALALVPSGHAHQLEYGDRVEHEATAGGPGPRSGDLDRYAAGPQDGHDLRVVCGRLQARNAFGSNLFDGLRAPLVFDFADSPEMVRVFERMLEEERGRSPGSSMMLNALMSEAMVLLFRRMCVDPECSLPWLRALENPRLREPLESILEHPEHDHSVESLATLAAMGRSAFAEAFKHSLGLSPMAYVRETRLRRAASLLQATDLTVDEIASRVGYTSRSQFSRAFATRFEVTPAAYRVAPADRTGTPVHRAVADA